MNLVNKNMQWKKIHSDLVDAISVPVDHILWESVFRQVYYRINNVSDLLHVNIMEIKQ